MKYTKKEIFSIPNLMGYLRILLIPIFVYLYLNADSIGFYLAAGAVILFSALLDFADGFVARRFNMVTDLGKMLDPISDKLTQAAVALCLATRYPLMVPLLALMLVKELYMAVRGMMRIASSGKVHGAAFMGKVCTATLFITFGALVFLPTIPLFWANLLILLSMIVMAITFIYYLHNFGKDRKRRPCVRIVKRAVLLLLCVFGFELIFLLVGLAAPFMIYPKVSAETVESFDASSLFEEQTVEARAKLLAKNSDALDERIRLMQLAKERIVISTFDIREGDAIRDMAAVMLERADAGVHISILGDAFSVELHMGGSALLDAIASHPNIEVRLYNRVNTLEPWKSQGRMHDKYVIVDDFAYIIGGRNTFDYFLTDDTDKGSYDCEVAIYEEPSEHSSLQTLYAYFERVWKGGECEPYRNSAAIAEQKEVQKERTLLAARYQELREESPHLFGEQDFSADTHEVSGVALLANPIHVYGKEPILFHQLCALMKRADERVMIHTPYAVLNSYMKEELTEVVRSVPNVSMMVNGIENGDNVVASSDYLYNKQSVLDRGVRLFEYQGGTSYHAKTVLIDDDLSVIGSYNFDLRSTYVDTELMLVVQSEGLNQELYESMQGYEESACEQLADGTQLIPSGVTVEALPFGKTLIYHFLGIVLQAFRFLA
ncbi:MAG: CDP-alcohol phosphatidyltransferase family protein [Clostridia bacterium]|nr:CDP-alcohol phosphatidyltransferase family protein [Clostridia bacterium]